MTRILDGGGGEVEGGFRVRLFGTSASEADQRRDAEATDTLTRLLSENGRNWWVYLEYRPRSLAIPSPSLSSNDGRPHMPAISLTVVVWFHGLARLRVCSGRR